jgi:hypothetical protein
MRRFIHDLRFTTCAYPPNLKSHRQICPILDKNSHQPELSGDEESLPRPFDLPPTHFRSVVLLARASMHMKTLTITLLVAVCFSASGADIAVWGEIGEAYSKISHPDVDLTHQAPAPITLTNHGVTQIGIERSACYGTCPVYTFVLNRDGTFRYKGEAFVERMGMFTGSVSVYEFNRLAQYMKDFGFMELRDGYGAPGDDGDTVFTMVVMNGTRKVVMDHSGFGPSKLWAMEQLIDHILLYAKWNARQPDGAANRSQPIPSDTNSTPSAAGSRR